MITKLASLPRHFAPSHDLTSASSNAANDVSDADLIARIARGDKGAMHVLYSRHNVRVFRFVLRFADNVSAAEDLVSDVFLDVWRKADKFEGRSGVSTWLLAIARNKAVGALRQRSIEPLDENAAARIEDPADTPEITTQKNETRWIMRKCLAQLSPAHREVIDLVYYHQKSVEDTAEIIGISLNTVKTRMFYARKRLAELLDARGITTALA